MRVTEERARASNDRAAGAGTIRARRAPRAKGHPDQLAAAQEIGEALAEALGAEVAVRPGRGGGYRAELEFDSREEALALAERLRRALSHAAGA